MKQKQKLAIFDLDNTLLNGDSDYLWGQFLVAQGVVDGPYYERENIRFYEDYKTGRLDIFAFLAFSLEPLARLEMSQLQALHRRFMQDCIIPIISPATRTLVAEHRAKGDFLLIITATNRFVTEPIAVELDVDELIATDPEIVDGRYTGKVVGVPCFREGKVRRLEQWLSRTGFSLDESWFYSDSHNDLPLLERVTHPVAVNPDDTLLDHARTRQWPIVNLRGQTPQPSR